MQEGIEDKFDLFWKILGFLDACSGIFAEEGRNWTDMVVPPPLPGTKVSKRHLKRVSIVQLLHNLFNTLLVYTTKNKTITNL